MVKNNSPSEIMDAILNSEAYEIYQRSLSLDQNLFIFDRNYQDLKMAIDKFSQEEHVDLLWDQHQSQIILYHISRFVHNFLAAAMTLVDHTRIIIRENYEGTSFYEEYQSEIGIRFKKNPLHQFIHDFRNFALHINLPITGHRISIIRNPETGNQEERVEFFIDKSTLTKWSGWEKGKEYLQELPEEISIENFIDKYYDLVLDFHTWLHKKLDELHKEDFDWLIQMQEELNELTRQLRDQSL
ncbi:hypothetical protein JR338_04345 [Chloroflexota bacterium]|nr:hypothetical protein JR338_04345 [Chloroflexota bacterium]